MTDGGIRLRIGIADVDALVPKGSAIDAHAAGNSTSVYTGVSVFPMLPDALSTDRTSLVEGGERLVVVIELEIGKDGAVRRHDIYRALAVNHAKLDYESVGAWLEGRGPEPDKVAADDGLEAQLWLQDRAAGLLKRLREQAGVLELDTVAVTPVAKDGVIESLRVTRKNRARDLIEDFMIAANGAIARFLAGGRPIGDPPRRARAAALGSHRRDRRVVRHPPAGGARRQGAVRLPGGPARRRSAALPRSVAQRRQAARPRRVHPRSAGPGRRHRPLRPGGARLHARHRAQPPLRRPRHAAAGEGGDRRRAGAVLRRRARRDRAALHRARERRQQGRARWRASRPPRCSSSAASAPPSTPSSPASSATPPTCACCRPRRRGASCAARAAWTSASACASAWCAPTPSAATSTSKASDAIGDAR